MVEPKENTQEAPEEEITEFDPDAPHPETPQSVLEEQGMEIREYQSKDNTAAKETWKRLDDRHKATHTVVLPDPESPGDTLTFTYGYVPPAHSMLVNDIAIVSGVIFNQKHERDGDTMEEAYEEGRLAEFLEVAKNNRHYQNTVIHLGLRGESAKTVEEVDIEITHPGTRNILFNLFRGGAKPRLVTDTPTDVDAFLGEVTEQRPEEEASAD